MPDVFDQIAPTRGRDIFDDVSVAPQTKKPAGFFAPDAFKGLMSGNLFVPERIAASARQKQKEQPLEMQGEADPNVWVDPLLAGTVSGAMTARAVYRAGEPLLKAGIRGLANAGVAALADIPAGVVTEKVAEKHPYLALPFNIALGVLSGVTVEKLIDKHVARRLGKTAPHIVSDIKSKIEKGDISDPISRDVVDEINSNPKIQEAAKQYRQSPKIGDIEATPKVDVFDQIAPVEVPKVEAIPPQGLVNSITRKEAGDMMVNGDKGVARHIAEGVIEKGRLQVEDAIRNEELGRIAKTPKGAQREALKQRLARLEPAINDALANPEAVAGKEKTPVTERRADYGRRETIQGLIDKGDIEGAHKAVYEDPLTGLLNAKAWKEVEPKATGKVIASMDISGLGWINDTFGHSSGDALLRAGAEELKAAGVEGYRKGGDEITGIFDNQEQADTLLSNAQKALANKTIEVTTPDGKKHTYTGWRLDYGTGKDFDTADKALYADRAKQVEAGLRGRVKGAKPLGMVEAVPERIETVSPTEKVAGPKETSQKRKAKAQSDTEISITDFVRKYGGLSTEKEALTGEIRDRLTIKEGFNLVNNKTGHTLDDMTSASIAGGFLPEGATIRDFLDAVVNDITAKKAKTQTGRAWSVFKQDFEVPERPIIEETQNLNIPAFGDIGAIAANKGKVVQEGLFGGPEIAGARPAKPISTREQPGLFAGEAKATPELPEAPKIAEVPQKEELPFGVTSGALPSISKEAGHLVLPEGLSRVGKSTKEFFVPLSTLPEGDKYKALRYKSFGDVDRAERFAGKIWDRTKNLTPEVKRDMFRFLDGEVSKGSLPANVRPLAQSLQTINNMIGKMLVNKGLLDEATYEAHKGQYIKYLYLKHLLPEDAKLPIGHSGKLDLSYLKGRMDPVVKVSRSGKEYVDKNVYEGILKVAEGLGVTHERRFKAKRGALGYATKGTGETVTQYGTELSVLAHEIGHQLDFKYNLWDRIVGEGISSKGKDVVNKELRALADLTFEGSEVSKYYKTKVRKTAEKMAHMLEAYIHAPTRFKEVAPETYSKFDSFIKSQPETAPLSKILQGLALKEVEVKHYQVTSRGGHAYTSPTLTLKEAKAKLPSIQKQVDNYRKEIGLVEDVSVAEPMGVLKPLTDISKHKFYSEIAVNPEWTWQPSVVTVDGKKMGIGALAEEVKVARQMFDQAPHVPEIKARFDRLDTALQSAITETKNVTEDYVQLPTSKSYGPLAGAYIRKEIARDIQPVFSGFNNQGDLSKAVNTIFQIERKGMAMFKVGKTAFNVPTIVRNMGSNVIQLNMSGIPLHDVPGLLVKSASAMKSKDKFYVEALRNGIFKTNWSEAEIGEVLDTVRTMQKTPVMQMFGQIGKLTKFYGKIDDFYKLAKFIEQREKGVDISKAAIEAHKWVMDYSLAHPAIKIARQHIMPFVSYQYKIAPLIAETLVKRPWVIAKYAAIPYLMYEAAKQTLSLSDDDFEKLKKDLPLYIKKTGSYAVMPWKSPEGNVQWVNLEYFIPWGNMMAIARDVKEGQPRDLIGDVGIGNPFLDVYSAIKTAKGDAPPQDPFSGREIWNALDSPTEKSLKMAEWLYGKWAPSMLTREGAGGYTLRVGEKDKYGRTITPAQAGGRWVGLNIIAPTKMQGAIEKRAREKELLSSLYRILKDPTITEGKKQRARDEFLKRARAIRGIDSPGQ